MAGKTEEGIGNPTQASIITALLATQLMDALTGLRQLRVCLR
ncbi:MULTISPECIES: hypothetical protein [unclassified Rhodococcus (in: high G+C Gram-positive bacteria)]|nr:MULTISPECIES: hypothetical protein [unclassified Rhodococcus (in: high G+C Gram-positive bacteria)]